ncbi:MAG: WD40 repeat domain-containing protein [Prochlorotrichaceae cyanobacterium]
MTLLTWLLTAEAIVLTATVLGFILTLTTGQPGYTLCPLVLAVLLNSWHRRFGDQRNRRGSIDALRRHRQEMRDELEQLRQTLKQAAPALDKRLAENYPDPASDLQVLQAVRNLQEQHQRLEHSVRQVVKALNQVLPHPILWSSADSDATSPSLSTPPGHMPHWQRGTRFTAHEGWVNALDISGDGHLLATGGNDQKLCLWNLDTGKLQQSCPISGPISALVFSPQGDRLASGGYDHCIQLWRVPKPQDSESQPQEYHSSHCLPEMSLEGHEGSVQTLIFVPGYLVSGSYDQQIRIWSLDQRQGQNKSICLEGHQGSVQCLAFDRDRECLLSGSEDGQILRWRFPDGEALGSLGKMSSALECLAISPDGEHLIAGCSDGTLRVWHLASGNALYVLEAHTGPLTALTVTVDGQTIISGGADGRLKLWYLPTGQAWGNLAEPVDAILDLRYCPHRKHLMSTHPGGQIQIWDEVRR